MTSPIVEKIQKLFALANDPAASEGERDNALRMAGALMAKYNIDQAAVHAKAGTKAKITQVEAEADKTWHGWISWGVAHLMGCKTTFNAQGNIVFYGPLEVIDAAKVTYESIVSQIEMLYKQNLPKGMSQAARANFRRTFKDAAASRVQQRIKEIVANLRTKDAIAQQATGCTALVIARSIDQQLAEIEEWMVTEGGFTRKPQDKLSRARRGGLGSSLGRKAGDQVKIQGTLR